MKVDIKKLVFELNKFRMNNQERLFTFGQIIEELHALGFGKSICQAIAAKMDFQQMGKAKMYRFGIQPIHQSEIAAIYQRMASYNKKRNLVPEFNQESAIKHLQAAGYQIRKPIGFDETRFKAEHPNLWAQYQKYEEI